jgi:hypothetical protein
MRYAGILVTLAMFGAGAVLAGNYRGTSSRMAAGADRWWRAGAVRRRLRWGVGTSPRPVGVVLMLMALVILAGLVFGRAG